MSKIAYEVAGADQNWVQPHQDARENEVERLKKRLPKHLQLDDASVAIVMAKPMERISKVS